MALSRSKVKIIELENISFSYNSKIVLKEVNLEVFEKDFLGIIGPNGSGKTTLIKIILGFLDPKKGSAKVFSKPPKLSRESIGYVAQGNFFDRSFPISVEELVLHGTLKGNSLLPFYSKSEKDKSQKTMKTLDIFDLRKKQISELSGGQLQRVFMARALANDPKLLILDEPTSHLDSKVEKDFYDLLNKLNKKMTILMVSHDISAVSKYVNKVACVNKKLVLNKVKNINKKGKSENLYGDQMNIIQHDCNL